MVMTRGGRRVLALVIGCGLLGLSLIAVRMGGPADPWSIVLGPLSLLAGVKIWTSSRASEPTAGFDPDPDAAEEGRKVGPVVGMVVLATLFAAVAAAVVLGVIAALAAISRGGAQILAGIFVLVAIFAMRKRR